MLKIMKMSLLAFDMHESGRAFIIYSGTGTFTLEDCLLRVAEPLAQWVSVGNAWNATFVSLSGGAFVFDRVDFDDVGVNKGDGYVISVKVGEGKTFRMNECRFSGGNMNETGDVILVTSGSVSPGISLTVTNCTFTRCYGANGGVFRYDSIFFYSIFILLIYSNNFISFFLLLVMVY
jgi:hypothetical protein